jgi:hypothetical protein
MTMKISIGVLLALVGAACGPPPLSNPGPSADQLARHVLSLVAARDETGLQHLALTEEEFEERVWPELPAARPERNMPWSYVWLDLQQKSRAMLKRTLSEHGGKRYELERVRFDGARTDHGHYRVFRETVLVVRDSAGHSLELRILGSMIEADEGWKVYSYVVDR